MAKRKKHRKKRHARHSPKKRHHRRRAHKRNPVHKKRRHVRRRHRRANPRAHKRRHHRARARHRNPVRRHHRRHHRRRHHRRNPLGFWGQIGVGLGAVVLGYAATFAAAFLASKDMAKDGARNRAIAGGVLGALGLYLAKKGVLGGPLAGLGLAGGALMQVIDSKVNTFVFGLMPKPAATPTTNAVFTDDMSGYSQLSAVYADNMAAVVQPDLAGYLPMQGMGDMGDTGDSVSVPQAPWTTTTPFDGRGY
jgi:hypothetical protein